MSNVHYLPTGLLNELCAELLRKLEEAQVHFYSENFQKVLSDFLEEILKDSNDKEFFRQRLWNEFCGNGPLEQFLKDPEISEVLVNSARDIWTEKKGKLEKAPEGFLSLETYHQYLRVLLNTLGKRADAKMPFADARLSDG